MCATSDERMEFVPGGPQPRIMLCILCGSAAPVIARPTSKHEAYTLIREGYIHELIHGEAMKEFEHDASNGRDSRPLSILTRRSRQRFYSSFESHQKVFA